MDKKPVPVDVNKSLFQVNEDAAENINFANRDEVVKAYMPLVQIIAAKFLASLTLLVIALLPTLLYVISPWIIVPSYCFILSLWE